jgi:hypothetical protein
MYYIIIDIDRCQQYVVSYRPRALLEIDEGTRVASDKATNNANHGGISVQRWRTSVHYITYPSSVESMH